MRSVMNSNRKGAVAEIEIAVAAIAHSSAQRPARMYYPC